MSPRKETARCLLTPCRPPPGGTTSPPSSQDYAIECPSTASLFSLKDGSIVSWCARGRARARARAGRGGARSRWGVGRRRAAPARRPSARRTLLLASFLTLRPPPPPPANPPPTRYPNNPVLRALTPSSTCRRLEIYPVKITQDAVSVDISNARLGARAGNRGGAGALRGALAGGAGAAPGGAAAGLTARLVAARAPAACRTAAGLPGTQPTHPTHPPTPHPTPPLPPKRHLRREQQRVHGAAQRVLRGPGPPHRVSLSLLHGPLGEAQPRDRHHRHPRGRHRRRRGHRDRAVL
jgi:hypothetical protein